MARCHLRFILRDKDGNVIQNGAVAVLQSNGITPVSGMWDSPSAGTAALNPLISNDEGEVEAWVDTPQSVVLVLSDNGGAAVYPGTPPVPTDPFGPISELAELYPSPEDLLALIAASGGGGGGGDGGGGGGGGGTLTGVSAITDFPAQPKITVADGTSAEIALGTIWKSNQADAPTYDATFAAVKTSLKPSNNASSTPGNSRCYANVPGGPVTLSGKVRGLLDIRYSASPGGVTYPLQEFAEMFIASGADMTGTLIRRDLPKCMKPDDWMNAFELIVAGSGLATVGSIGLRHKGSPTPGKTADKVIVYLRLARWDEATEIDVAAAKATGTVVIPSNFVPSPTVPTQWFRDIPTAARFLDLRPGRERLTQDAGVRSLRDHMLPEDGSREVAQDLNRAISAAAIAGRPLVGAPKAKYKANGPFGWRSLSGPVFDGQGCIFFRDSLGDVNPVGGFSFEGNRDFLVGNFEWLGFRNQLTAGAGLASVTTNRLTAADAENDDQGYAKTGPLSGWTADAQTNLTSETSKAKVPGGASRALANKSGATSDISMALPTGTGGYTVEPTTGYTVSASFRPLTSPRACEIQVNWYQASGVASSHASDILSMGTETATTTWTDSTNTITSPADAAFCSLIVRFKAVAWVTPANETHYVDSIKFRRTAARAISTTVVATLQSPGTSENGYLATFSTVAAHGLVAGRAITVVGNSNALYNDNWVVAAVIDATTFTAYMDSNGGAAGNAGTVSTDALLTSPGDELARIGKMYGKDKDGLEKFDIVVSGNGTSTATLEMRVIDDDTEQVYAYQTVTVLAADARVTKQLTWVRPNRTEFERVSVRRIDRTGGNVLVHHIGEYSAAYYSNRLEFADGCTIAADPPNLNGALWGINIEGATGPALTVAGGLDLKIGLPGRPIIGRAMGLDMGHTGGDRISFDVESYGGARSAFDIEPTAGLNDTLHSPKYKLRLFGPHNNGVAMNPWAKIVDAEWDVEVYRAGISAFDGGGRNAKIHRLISDKGVTIRGVNIEVQEVRAPGIELIDGSTNSYTDDAGNTQTATSGGARVYGGYCDPALGGAGYFLTLIAGSPTSQFIGGPSEIVTPPQITADQNDYTPASLGFAGALRLSSDASRTITGLTGGWSAREIRIHNVGAFNITLADEGAGSTAANRFAFETDVILRPDTSALLRYDPTTTRWRMLGTAPPPLFTILSPAQITADQNNYAPAGIADAGVLRVTTDASRTLTGLVAPTVEKEVRLVNVGANPLLLSDENASSTAANRFALDLPTVLLAPDVSVILRYDLVSTRWRILGDTAALRTSISPAQITSDQNNYNPTGLAGAGELILTGDTTTSRRITGLAGGSAGREFRIVNLGICPLLLTNQDAASTAANRFAFDAPIVPIPSEAEILLRYNATEARWKLVGTTTDMRAVLTPAQITAAQDDYYPTGGASESYGIWRLSSDAARNITGIAGGWDGRRLVILNVGGNDITLKDQNAGSIAANRFNVVGDSLLVGGGAGLILYYDGLSSRWKRIG